MPDLRYTVPGIGAGPAAGITAFLPHLNRRAASGAQSYKYAVRGYPGTQAHPAPTGEIQPTANYGDTRDTSDQALMGTSRSQDAPDAWWPQDYDQTFIAERPGAGMPVAVYSPTQPGLTTVIPVPATDFRATWQRDSARLSRRAPLNRVAEVPWFPRTYRAPRGSWNG